MDNNFAVWLLGQPGFQRYVIVDARRRYWTGKRWSRRLSKALLFADLQAAGNCYTAMQATLNKDTPPRVFSANVTVTVWELTPYTLNELRDYLQTICIMILDLNRETDFPPTSITTVSINWETLEEEGEQKHT